MDKNNQAVPLVRLDKIKDIGVHFHDKLQFKEHMHKKVTRHIYDVRLNQSKLQTYVYFYFCQTLLPLDGFIVWNILHNMLWLLAGGTNLWKLFVNMLLLYWGIIIYWLLCGCAVDMILYTITFCIDRKTGNETRQTKSEWKVTNFLFLRSTVYYWVMFAALV